MRGRSEVDAENDEAELKYVTVRQCISRLTGQFRCDAD